MLRPGAGDAEAGYGARRGDQAAHQRLAHSALSYGYATKLEATLKAEVVELLKRAEAANAKRAGPGNIAVYPPADITVERIGDLANADSATLLGNAVAGRAQQEAS